MNRADRALLEALQADSSRSIAELAALVNLSSSACHRRIRALEEQGLITGYAARVDPRRLGLSVEVFVEITLTSQSRDAMERFERAVGDFDDILECHLMSGTADYQLRVAAADLDHYDRIHRDCLARLPGVSSMRTSFSLRRIKRFAGYSVP
ncbi:MULTISPECIES: Lrp/AsnC family transcriptional regulator [Novosphingobium]|uniref:Lrp/AsnC family transcriptional regulator n=1 Tax=Novosphingobium pentaromativorans TaxID=205844 RepID=A0A2W5QDG8_9SPHN|nr:MULTISPECIES: Lrp/AsnC family transcriptional regulator [Novosphingobium]PZQ52773.1 MAG: Lrp/AsnC family transcriptional regulator [Novosphingobium pentaromativorans]GFE73225.1 AsnC family transcriptional regulator [Novosphingobium sp. TCA1]